MKRILSLVLVLVMLIGVMPVALADGKEVSPDGTISVSAPEELTVGQSGTVALTAFTTGGGTTLDAEQLAAATFTLSSSDASVASVDGATVTGVAAGTATITVSATFEASKINTAETTFTVTVKAAEEAVSYAVTAAAELELAAKETGSAVPTISPEPASDVAVTVEYSSSNTAVATVDNEGTVTAVAKGEATITAKVTIGSTTPVSVTTKVTVTDEITIVCENVQKAYSSSVTVTLAPSLSEVVEDTVSWTFAVLTGGIDATVSESTAKDKLTIDPAEAGLLKVKITAAWGDNKSAEKTVMVSFYDVKNADVAIADKVTSFQFVDLDVFSTVKLDNVNVYKPENYSMSHLWGMGITYDSIGLMQKDASSKVAEISYTQSIGSATNPFKPGAQNKYLKSHEDNLKFTCLSRGEFVLYYDLELNGMLVRTGTITITVSEGGADVEYNTSFDKPVTLDENDFEKLWASSANKSKLDYVIFTSSAIVGDLYTDSTATLLVNSRHTFHNDYSVTKDTGVYDYDLDLVTYVPFKKAAEAYTDTISFTCVGEDTDETLSGVLVISVGEKVNFTDVKTTDYFYDAVVWAVNDGVTNGLSDTQFGPNATCTRAQVVTFLWRAAGEPEPTTSYMPFKDVEDDAYYYDAVLWAVEEDITTGTSSTTFSPNATVTRGQVVTFLWRAEGSETVRGVNPFKDVDADDYYYEAVLWAVENDITTGLSATQFGPNSGCTRGQIVTFLYRNYEED